MFKRALFIVIWIVAGVPLIAAAGGGTTTFTTSASTGVGAINATYIWTTAAAGPGMITTGNFGACTLPSGPFPGCTQGAGTGTPGDPFVFQCMTALALTNCTLPGTALVLAAGTTNVNTHTHVQLAATAPATPPLPVPLGAWVPAFSVAAVVLAALARRRLFNR